MKVIAFDQATNITGWSILESFTGELITYGIIDTSYYSSIEEKISKQKAEIKKIIETYKPEVFALEDVQYQQNQYTYKILAELLGVLSNTFYENQYCFMIVPPSQWKSFCGVKGKRRDEQKANAIQFVKSKFGIDVSSDIADSVCIGWYVTNKLKRG